MPLEPDADELVCEHDGRRLTAKVAGQFAAELDQFEHVPGGVAFNIACIADRKSPSHGRTFYVGQAIWFCSIRQAPAATTGFRRQLAIVAEDGDARPVVATPSRRSELGGKDVLGPPIAR